jgi:hypothetical protein
LAEAGGAPLTAMCLRGSERSDRAWKPFSICSQSRRNWTPAPWRKSQKDLQLVGCLGMADARWVHDASSQLRSGRRQPLFRDRSRGESIAGIARQADLVGLLDFQRELTAAGRWLRHPLSPAVVARILADSLRRRLTGGRHNKPDEKQKCTLQNNPPAEPGCCPWPSRKRPRCSPPTCRIRQGWRPVHSDQPALPDGRSGLHAADPDG